MLVVAKKVALIALVALVGFVAYKAIGLYVYYTIAETMAQCTSMEEIASLKSRKAPGVEVEKFMHTTYSCVKEKENSIQAHYFQVPDNWLNPPPGSVTYESIHIPVPAGSTNK